MCEATLVSDAYCPRSRLNPWAATWRIERSLPAPIQICGCGFCAGGGSTTMSSNSQYLPRWLKGLVGGPRLQQDLEALLEPRVGFLHRHAEARELVVPIALADPEIEPAPGQEIERRGLFRQQHRVVPWQHHDSGAETQPARARSDPGQEIERGRHLTVAREVVLHDERAVQAQRLRLDVVVDEIAKSLAAVEFRTTAPRRRTAEQAESHVVVLPSGSYQLLARCNRPSFNPINFRGRPMKIAVIHDYADVFRTTRAYKRLQGHDVVVHTDAYTDPARVVEQVAGCEAVLLTQQRVPVTREIVARLPDLRFISQTSANVYHIDLAACTEHGVVVSAGRGGGGGGRTSYSTTAELTWGLILASLRHLPFEGERLKQGHWHTTVGTRLEGNTLGIYAFGHIWAPLAPAGRAFGVKGVCWGREGSTARAG